MKILHLIFLIAIVLMIGCTEKKSKDQMDDEQLRVLADELAHKFIITDGHVDLPSRLKEKKIQFGEYGCTGIDKRG